MFTSVVTGKQTRTSHLTLQSSAPHFAFPACEKMGDYLLVMTIAGATFIYIQPCCGTLRSNSDCYVFWQFHTLKREVCCINTVNL